MTHGNKSIIKHKWFVSLNRTYGSQVLEFERNLRMHLNWHLHLDVYSAFCMCRHYYLYDNNLCSHFVYLTNFCLRHNKYFLYDKEKKIYTTYHTHLGHVHTLVFLIKKTYVRNLAGLAFRSHNKNFNLLSQPQNNIIG